MAGVVMIGVAVLAALLADIISPVDPNHQNYQAVLQPPSTEHPLGTDNVGRDILSRVIHGSRIALFVGVSSVGIAVVLGAALGLLSGYLGGWVDDVIMRVMDALYSFPSVLLALGITAALGPGVGNIIVAIAVVNTPIFARVTRGQVLSVRERDFVVAARTLGARPIRIVLRHIWPHVTAAIIVLGSLHVSFAILTEAALSFLGLGVQPPTASWGAMLRTGFSYMTSAPWLALFPGLAIFVTVLGLNILGDSLRDALDPHLSDDARLR